MDFKAAPVADDGLDRIFEFLLFLVSRPEIVIGLAAFVLITGLWLLQRSQRARRRRRRITDVYL